MKKIITLLLILVVISFSFAQHVDEATAKLVGKNFIAHIPKANVFEGHIDLQKVYAAKLNNTTTFYVFNINTSKGFVIVSADQAIEPILAYSTQGAFVVNHIPPGLSKLLGGYKTDISHIIKNKIPAGTELTERWQALINGTTGGNKNITAVGPLLTTQWSQNPYYNDLCPIDQKTGQKCVTGCPATAMAQIMKFWNYPASGSSIYAYSTPNAGIVAANFSKAAYNWSNMPNTLSSTNLDLAKLMYHCGVSVKTTYTSKASSAYVVQSQSANGNSSENAYKNYFGYDRNAIQGLVKANFTDTAWSTAIRNELDAGRPIQYVGFGAGGGHTWVCDGYSNNLFHMNWGWGGYCDGNYLITALNPTVNQNTTGGGLGQYNSDHQMLIGIKPPSNQSIPQIILNSAISVLSNTINLFQPVSVNVDIKNVDVNDFNGDYCAAVFDSNGELITILDSISTSGTALASGGDYSGSGGLTFTDSSGLINENGNYSIQIYYKPTGEENWQLAGDNSYPNDESVTVTTSPNDLKLNSTMSVNPPVFVQGQSASVAADILNNLPNDFTGDFKADLYNLDGNFVETIGTYTESTGLTSGTAYGSPITFSSASINAEPGTYTIAISSMETNGTTWNLCGSDLFPNPITIDIITPDMAEDAYEPNNDAGSASNLNMNFVYNSGDSGSVNTAGANIPEGSTYDYYQVDLPPGFDYMVYIDLNDFYHATDGQIYSLDGIVSYTTDTTMWTNDAYDDVVPPVLMPGGTTLYLAVSPYFIGDEGTYNLYVSMDRLITTNSKTIENNNSIRFYPNPAKDYVIVDLSKSAEQVKQIKIYNTMGQEVQSIDEVLTTTNRISLNDLTEGVYIVKAFTATNVITKQLVLHK